MQEGAKGLLVCDEWECLFLSLGAPIEIWTMEAKAATRFATEAEALAAIVRSKTAQEWNAKVFRPAPHGWATLENVR